MRRLRNASTLLLNIDVPSKGYLKVDLLAASGDVLPLYAGKQAASISGPYDELCAVAKFGPAEPLLPALSNMPFRLRFTFRGGAKLYAFRFVPPSAVPCLHPHT